MNKGVVKYGFKMGFGFTLGAMTALVCTVEVGKFINKNKKTGTEEFNKVKDAVVENLKNACNSKKEETEITVEIKTDENNIEG